MGPTRAHNLYPLKTQPHPSSNLIHGLIHTLPTQCRRSVARTDQGCSTGPFAPRLSGLPSETQVLV
eukprot:5223974-Pyramimonas_sp.AAC.1